MRDARQMAEKVETILNEGRHLTKWEHNFLESMSDRLESRRGLSDREEEIIERIYEERCNG